MSEHDDVGPLLAWYASGVLEGAERDAVERHLGRCAACRDLADQARGQSEALFARAGELLDHVHPRLLTEYVEAPATLDAETVAWIERRLESCATCREASEALARVERYLSSEARDAAPAVAGESALRRAAGAAWGALRATVLRPAPALAYLLALAALLPAIVVRGVRGPELPPAAVVSRIVTTGEPDVREGGSVAPRPPPLEIPAVGDRPVLLELQTDLVSHDLAGPGASFVLELSRGGEVLLSEPRSGADFVVRDGRGVLLLVLRPGRLAQGEYRVVIRADRPGDPLDGYALFRRGLRVVGGSGANPVRRP